jgi:hypothetical protein
MPERPGREKGQDRADPFAAGPKDVFHKGENLGFEIPGQIIQSLVDAG